MKQFMRGAAAITAAMLASPAAQAAAVGNVGVFSDYVFRGLVAEGGAAVQGGIDYYHASGLFVGTWVSNANPFGGNEWDVYGGYIHKINDKVTIDAGVLGYIFTEDEERDNTDTDGDGIADAKTNLDTVEYFVGAIIGPVKAQVYYSDDYTGTSEEGWYYTGTLTLPLKDTVNLLVQAGYTHGDGTDIVYGDSYVDYSLTVAKTVREGLVFSLMYINTNLEDEDSGPFVGADDKPKFLVSAKQTFAF